MARRLEEGEAGEHGRVTGVWVSYFNLRWALAWGRGG